MLIYNTPDDDYEPADAGDPTVDDDHECADTKAAKVVVEEGEREWVRSVVDEGDGRGMKQDGRDTGSVVKQEIGQTDIKEMVSRNIKAMAEKNVEEMVEKSMQEMERNVFRAMVEREVGDKIV